MHDLIASPFLGDYLVLRNGNSQGLRISQIKYLELQQATVAGDLALPSGPKAVRGLSWPDRVATAAHHA